MTLRIGFAERDITPPLGLPLGGYAARSGGATGMLDPLSCRAAVLADGKSSIAIVALDLIHVAGDWVRRVRELVEQAVGIPPERVLIAATHTHAGPAVFHSWLKQHDAIMAYEHKLAGDVVSCVADASSKTAPAEVRSGSALAAGIAANRRDANLPVDNAVRVLSAHATDGGLLGVVANFACHSTVLSAENQAYSGDLLGVSSRLAEERLGVPVLCTNGAAGDVSTRFTRHGQTYSELRRLAGILSDSIRLAARAAKVIPVDDAALAGARESVPLRWHELPPAEVAAADLEAARRDLEAAHAGDADAGQLRLMESRLEGVPVLQWITARGGWQAVLGLSQPVAELQALRCGTVAVVAAPGELFSEAGQYLQRCLRGGALVVGYANDYLGYFVPEADAAAGGYEALVAMVDPACEATIRDQLVKAAQAVGCQVRTTSGAGAAGDPSSAASARK